MSYKIREMTFVQAKDFCGFFSIGTNGEQEHSAICRVAVFDEDIVKAGLSPEDFPLAEGEFIADVGFVAVRNRHVLIVEGEIIEDETDELQPIPFSFKNVLPIDIVLGEQDRDISHPVPRKLEPMASDHVYEGDD